MFVLRNHYIYQRRHKGNFFDFADIYKWWGMQIYGMLLKFHLCNNTSGIHFGLTQNIIIFVMTSLLIGLLLVDIMACSPFVILGAMLKESIMNNGILAR